MAGKLKDDNSVFSDSAVGTSIVTAQESESQPFEVNFNRNYGEKEPSP